MDAAYVILFLLVLLTMFFSCLCLLINILVCLVCWFGPCTYHLFRSSVVNIFDPPTSFENFESDAPKELKGRMLNDFPLLHDEDIMSMSNPSIQEPSDIQEVPMMFKMDEDEKTSSSVQQEPLYVDSPHLGNTTTSTPEINSLVDDKVDLHQQVTFEEPLDLVELMKKIDSQPTFGMIKTHISSDGSVLSVTKYEDLQSYEQKINKCSVTFVFTIFIIYVFCVIPFFLWGFLGWIPNLALGIISSVHVDSGAASTGETVSMIVFAMIGVFLSCLLIPISFVLCGTCIVAPNRTSEIVYIDVKRKRLGIATGIPVLFLCESIPLWIRYVDFKEISQVHLISETDKHVTSASSGGWRGVGTDYVYYTPPSQESEVQQQYGNIIILTKKNQEEMSSRTNLDRRFDILSKLRRKYMVVFQNVYLGVTMSRVGSEVKTTSAKDIALLSIAKQISNRSKSEMKRVEGRVDTFSSETILTGRIGGCVGLLLTFLVVSFMFVFALIITIWFITDASEGDVFLAVIVGLVMIVLDSFVCLLCFCLCFAAINAIVECVWCCGDFE